MDGGRVVRVSESLPCGVLLAGVTPCGRDARVLWLDAMRKPPDGAPWPTAAQYWLALPVCDRCAGDMAALYEGGAQ